MKVQFGKIVSVEYVKKHNMNTQEQCLTDMPITPDQ